MYDGPVAELEVLVAGRPLVLVRPSEPDRLLDEPDVLAWNRRDDYMPYWAYLWPAAYLLAEVVAVEPWKAESNALEIGCGLGLAGLSAVCGFARHIQRLRRRPARFRPPQRGEEWV